MKAIHIQWDVDEVEDLEYLPAEVEISNDIKQVNDTYTESRRNYYGCINHHFVFFHWGCFSPV